MSNAATILRALDRHLTKATPLVLYGRAALVLGFPHPPPDTAFSMDVDVILTREQSATLDDDVAFWAALEGTNADLAPSGLYVTHLFDEDQVILRPQWQDFLVAVHLPDCRWLTLSRPHALDLLLTKMMRGLDPQDMADAQFIIQAEALTVDQVSEAIRTARLPEVEEIRAAFHEAKARVLEMAKAGGC